jgi:hypothetical protein
MDLSAPNCHVFVQISKTSVREFKSADLEKTETELIIKRDGEIVGEFQRAATLAWWKEPGDPSPAAVAKLADLRPEELEYFKDRFEGREPKMKLVPKEPTE